MVPVWLKRSRLESLLVRRKGAWSIGGNVTLSVGGWHVFGRVRIPKNLGLLPELGPAPLHVERLGPRSNRA